MKQDEAQVYEFCRDDRAFATAMTAAIRAGQERRPVIELDVDDEAATLRSRAIDLTWTGDDGPRRSIPLMLSPTISEQRHRAITHTIDIVDAMSEDEYQHDPSLRPRRRVGVFTLFDLKPHQCRFPINDGQPEFLFCGAPKAEWWGNQPLKTSYCADHHDLCCRGWVRLA